MNEVYEQIKNECNLPVAILTYTYKDFDGTIHPFNSINVDFKDDEINIKKMEEVRDKYGEFFMFFNNSVEGKEFWKANPITITTKQQKVMSDIEIGIALFFCILSCAYVKIKKIKDNDEQTNQRNDIRNNRSL